MQSEYALSRTAAVNKVPEQIELLKVGFDCVTVVISNLALPLPDESDQLIYFLALIVENFGNGARRRLGYYCRRLTGRIHFGLSNSAFVHDLV